MLKSDKIWCAHLVANCVSLQTFWTPLVCCPWMHPLYRQHYHRQFMVFGCSSEPHSNSIRRTERCRVTQWLWTAQVRGGMLPLDPCTVRHGRSWCAETVPSADVAGCVIACTFMHLAITLYNLYTVHSVPYCYTVLFVFNELVRVGSVEFK